MMMFTVVWGLARPSWRILLDDSFLGHVLRKDELEKLVVTGLVDGKRDRERDTMLTYLGSTRITFTATTAST